MKNKKIICINSFLTNVRYEVSQIVWSRVTTNYKKDRLLKYEKDTCNYTKIVVAYVASQSMATKAKISLKFYSRIHSILRNNTLIIHDANYKMN